MLVYFCYKITSLTKIKGRDKYIKLNFNEPANIAEKLSNKNQCGILWKGKELFLKSLSPFPVPSASFKPCSF